MYVVVLSRYVRATLETSHYRMNIKVLIWHIHHPLEWNLITCVCGDRGMLRMQVNERKTYPLRYLSCRPMLNVLNVSRCRYHVGGDPERGKRPFRQACARDMGRRRNERVRAALHVRSVSVMPFCGPFPPYKPTKTLEGQWRAVVGSFLPTF